MTIQELKTNILSEHKSIQKIGNNRYKVEKEDRTEYYLHITPIVTYIHCNKSIILRNDGYYTNTTKNAMNEILKMYHDSIRLFQKNGKWYFEKEGIISDFYNLFTFKI